MHVVQKHMAKTHSIARKENSYDVYLFWIALITLGAFMFFYFVEINNLATMGYRIKKHQKSLESLRAENSALALEIAQKSAPQAINEKARSLSLVPASQTRYIQGSRDLSLATTPYTP